MTRGMGGVEALLIGEIDMGQHVIEHIVDVITESLDALWRMDVPADPERDERLMTMRLRLREMSTELTDMRRGLV